MTYEAEEDFVWEAKAGTVELESGECVTVRGGDVLTGRETPDGIAFVAVKRVTRH